MRGPLTYELYLHTFEVVCESIVHHHGRPKTISDTWILKCPIRKFLRKYPDKKRIRIVTTERERGWTERQGRAMTSQDLTYISVTDMITWCDA